MTLPCQMQPTNDSNFDSTQDKFGHTQVSFNVYWRDCHFRAPIQCAFYLDVNCGAVATIYNQTHVEVIVSEAHYYKDGGS